LKTIARAQLLILDDWGLAHLTPEQGRGSTIAARRSRCEGSVNQDENAPGLG